MVDYGRPWGEGLWGQEVAFRLVLGQSGNNMRENYGIVSIYHVGIWLCQERFPLHYRTRILHSNCSSALFPKLDIFILEKQKPLEPIRSFLLRRYLLNLAFLLTFVALVYHGYSQFLQLLTNRQYCRQNFVLFYSFFIISIWYHIKCYILLVQIWH